MRIASMFTVAGLAAALAIPTSAFATSYVSLPGFAGIPEATNDWNSFFIGAQGYHGGIGLANTSDPQWHFIDFALPLYAQTNWAPTTITAAATMSGGIMLDRWTPFVGCQLVSLTHDGSDYSWTWPVVWAQNLVPGEETVGQITTATKGSTLLRCQVESTGVIESVRWTIN